MTPTDDLTSATQLVKRYRELCEARGLARAHRLPLESSLDEELGRVEEQLIARLNLAINPPPRTNTTPAVRPAAPPTPSIPSTTVSATPARDVTNSPAVTSNPEPPGGLSATIFTDGSAEGNPGPGGYCALLRLPGRPDRELSGGTVHTTNNKMELTAAIAGLKAAIDAGATDLTVISDSEYLIKGMTRWLPGWIAKNWLTAEKLPVKNRELWEQLAELSKSRNVHWTWVRGHAGHPENERCDAVATAAARQAASKLR